MAKVTEVGITAGVGTTGTGTASTLDGIFNRDAGPVVLATAAAVTATSLFLPVAFSATASTVSIATAQLGPLYTVATAMSAGYALVGIPSDQTVTTTAASRNYLWYAGYTTNNGLVATAATLMTTELSALATGATIISSVNGASGVFNNSNFGQATECDIYLTWGATAGSATAAAGGNISGWFLTSPDGGVTYETTTTSPIGLPRAPDFVIPVRTDIAITTASVFKTQGTVVCPATYTKLYVQNNMSIAFMGTGASLKLAPIAKKY